LRHVAAIAGVSVRTVQRYAKDHFPWGEKVVVGVDAPLGETVER
jgi:hypothetical protein